MEQQKVEMFLATQGNKFPIHTLHHIREQLERMDDRHYPILMSVSFKDPILLLILSILIGHLGIDRFLLGETGTGIAKLLTCGGLGIWTVVDWFLIMNMTREHNYKEFMKLSSSGYF